MDKFSKSDFIYTSCYCEENVYKLCELLNKKFSIPLSKIYAVFISNEDKQVLFWRQKSQKNNSVYPVVWDYHVIAVVEGEEGQPNVIFDLDSTLPFPCEFNTYLINAIYPKQYARIVNEHQGLFRVIPADMYFKNFASDRSHMIDSEGQWLQPPPKYPPISTKECTMNIHQFINMTSNIKSEKYGTVYTLKEFIDHFMNT
ncbi:hypothetical protein H8356DRAFT_1674692 [Neocallimastix lanati (nom. inval.)]|uniref:Protein N-terminal glutamine amidohydrolase n=1 Tax=Neocallimastix californiae TaxID=1754190 RepID=A0A1Y2AGZ4_9FUNG|nr:hypothetical protein H8356DRAFT_1674692 [Neocallimastix sp. JGI-2020a]ORY21724.1 hypothetical protein LY90DRAFT_676153 [Neocallimastix californiae]|eukprot:ORY21724.1 hypothetical protein LY90DRAFT_676153 [Neocallimastix californiae]